MTVDPECCLCPRCPKFATWVDLAAHLCKKHENEPLGRTWEYLTSTYDHSRVFCWCMVSKDISFAEFAEHLRDRGGLAAHLLELSLGV
jgi:hypothetical protein